MTEQEIRTGAMVCPNCGSENLKPNPHSPDGAQMLCDKCGSIRVPIYAKFLRLKNDNTR